ncbi:MAG TPA: phenylacetyl CoA, partial [Acetobacteraceae bacterium]|nr:phenylacetyl CoA [Acetobacteraceae bacterium]
ARRQRSWDLRAAGNFIGGGSGSGLILLAGVAAASGAPFRLPLAIGLGAVLAGLSLVWLEIGRPWRALNVFFHPQTSWMTREGIVAVVLLPLGLLALAAAGAPAALAAAGLAGGFLYCQARILRAARAIPAWRQAEIVPLILASGLAEGSGLFLLLGSARPAFVLLALGAGLAREAAWAAYRAGLAAAPLGAPVLAAFAQPAGQAVRVLRLAGLALTALALLPGGVPGAAAAGGMLMALAGWGMKGLLITRAGYVRAPRIPVVPTRGSRVGHAPPTLSH